MATPAKIIILNGAGSAGKTSIARALQTVTDEPFLHVEMDSFMAMMVRTRWIKDALRI